MPRNAKSLAIALLIGVAACRSDEPKPRRDADPAQQGRVASAAELANSMGLDLQPPSERGVPVRVVDGASGRPVGDALVVAIDESEFTYRQYRRDRADPWDARSLLREQGSAFVTSGDGVVRIAAPTSPTCVLVWSGERFGRTTLEVHDTSDHVVSVAPRSLEVEVVDREGRPQSSLPIQIGKCSIEPMSLGTTVGTTGADGRCSIPALELERGVHRSCGRRCLLMPGALVFEWEMRAVDAASLDPVRFTLPDCGSIDVELQDSGGRPLTRAAIPDWTFILECYASEPDEPRGTPRCRWSAPERSIAAPVASNGHCRLDWVEVGALVGARLLARAEALESSEDTLQVVGGASGESLPFPGPTRAGEVIHVALRAANFRSEDLAQRARSKTDPPVAESRESPASTASGPPEVTSSLDVAVLLDAPIQPCWLSVRLDGGRDPYESDRDPWIDVNGRATARNVPPGTHSIEIVERRISQFASDVALRRIDGIEVAPSTHLRDPRLLGIDLRGVLRPHHLTVVDVAGHALAGVVELSNADDAEHSDEIYFDQVYFERGRADFLTAKGDGLRARILVDRFRPLHVDLAAEQSRIVLTRGIPIRIELAPGFDFPAEFTAKGRLLVAVSEFPHDRQDVEPPRAVELTPGGDARFVVAEPGEWPVSFSIVHVGDDGQESTIDRPSLDTTITVQDRDDEQTIVVTPDRDCWNAAVGSP